MSHVWWDRVMYSNPGNSVRFGGPSFGREGRGGSTSESFLIREVRVEDSSTRDYYIFLTSA